MTRPNERPITVIQVQLIAIALALTPLIYLLLCFIIQKFVMEKSGSFGNLPSSLHMILFVVGLSIGTTSIFGGHFLRGLMLSQAQAKNLKLKMRIVIVTLTFGETSAIFGLVFFLITGKLIEASILIALGFASAITLFPTRRWLEKE